MKKEKIINISIIVACIVLALFLIYIIIPRNQNQVDDYNTNSSSLENINTQTNQTVPKKENNISKQDSKTYIDSDGMYVVRYTDNGFVPTTLTIPRGKAVKFINESSKGMRIFSSEQTNQKFLELNEAKTIGKGSSYVFSFIYTGLWTYYNQAFPAHFGSVSVY